MIYLLYCAWSLRSDNQSMIRMCCFLLLLGSGVGCLCSRSAILRFSIQSAWERPPLYIPSGRSHLLALTGLSGFQIQSCSMEWRVTPSRSRGQALVAWGIDRLLYVSRFRIAWERLPLYMPRDARNLSLLQGSQTLKFN